MESKETRREGRRKKGDAPAHSICEDIFIHVDVTNVHVIAEAAVIPVIVADLETTGALQ